LAAPQFGNRLPDEPGRENPEGRLASGVSETSREGVSTSPTTPEGKVEWDSQTLGLQGTGPPH